MTRAARLTQAEVTRFVRGVLQAAKKEEKSVAAVDIRADGSARVFFGEPAHAPDLTSEGPDEWDRIIANA